MKSGDTVVVDFSQYAILLEGQVCVRQIIQCMACSMIGPGYINMVSVEDDKLIGFECPYCGEEKLEIVTYRD